MKQIGIVLLLWLLLAGCIATGTEGGKPAASGHGHQEPHITKHYEGSHTMLTAANLYSLELVVPRKEVRMGVNSLELIVHHGLGGDVPDAEVTVTPWMPGMGHGVMEKPVIIERGGGLYSLENVVFSMTGHWQLQVTVNKDGKTDGAVFDFPEVGAMGHGHGTAAMPMAAMDAATSRLSENGLFAVSYESRRTPIPMNRIHSWTLEIKTATGQPVPGAKITVVGDMPEHGHGLPSIPVIAAGAADGIYEIEGMKFTMPGWWVVTFHVQAGEIQDSVSFNLHLQ